MKKQKKIDYINKVNERFLNARNHGHQGNSWWYPTKNTIAYNVKMYGVNKGILDIRKLMTARQNDFYSDDSLYEFVNEHQNDEARMFSDDLDAEYGVKSGYSGRSGGWLEVEYQNNIGNYEQNDWNYSHRDDLNAAYCEAKKLEALEATIAARIEKAHKSLMKYMNTDQYCKDIVEYLLTDEDIADHYKSKAKGLLDKLR